MSAQLGYSGGEPARRTYSVDEAAVMLGISRSLAYVCVKTGELPSLKFRRRIVIPAFVIDKLTTAAEIDVQTDQEVS